ncbi:MAG: hypothetical protein CBC82_04360 [Cellvibrionales bacterium TMED122]|nr:MAG: hypothetical protein CBC82_04360 [Cellvibrionales bacterium TMED122]|tara:strand:- start:83 stop:1723 length:1641 start_codon:yes stop_codon:yes gene_type:complete
MDKEKQKNLNFIEEKKGLDKYPDIVFLPVSIENLADYIANGFVGLLTKKDRVQDYQSTFWPKYRFYDTHQLKSIHLKEDTALISIDKKNTRLFQDNLSMLNVSDIFFPSKEIMKEFLATFKIMDDVPVLYFSFKVDEDLFKLNANKKEIKLEKIYEDKNKSLKLFTTAFIYAIISYFRSINDSSNIVSLVQELNLENAKSKIYEIFEKVANVEKISVEKYFLVEILNIFLRYHKQEELNSNNKILQILKELSDESSNFNQKDLVKKTILKLKNIFDGISERDSLNDEDNKIVLRAFYLSLIVKGEEDLVDASNRFNSGKIVTLVAYLFYFLRKGYRSCSLWKKDKREYNNLHQISQLLFSGKSITFSASNIEFTKVNTIKRDIFLNNSFFIKSERKPDPEFTHIQAQIDIIRKKVKERYSEPIPFFDELGNPKIKISQLAENKEYDIDFILYEFKPEFSEKPSIIIETDIFVDEFSKVVLKDELNIIRKSYLVNIIEDKNVIRLFATNLLETLDDAELEFGIKKLAEAKNYIKKLHQPKKEEFLEL